MSTTANSLGACEPCFLRHKQATATHVVADTPMCETCFTDGDHPIRDYTPRYRKSLRAKVIAAYYNLPLAKWKEVGLWEGNTVRRMAIHWSLGAASAGGKVETKSADGKLFVRRMK